MKIFLPAFLHLPNRHIKKEGAEAPSRDVNSSLNPEDSFRAFSLY